MPDCLIVPKNSNEGTCHEFIMSRATSASYKQSDSRNRPASASSPLKACQK